MRLSHAQLAGQWAAGKGNVQSEATGRQTDGLCRPPLIKAVSLGRKMRRLPGPETPGDADASHSCQTMMGNIKSALGLG